MSAPVEPHASVVIPTRDGMPLVGRCLRAVLEQEAPWPFEVIVVDSGSRDGTWELVQSLPVQRFRIDPRDFNHGRTRNLAAQRALGQHLVFLVQDAIPADRRWLANLVRAVEAPNVVAAYSRQLPRSESSAVARYLVARSTPCEEKRAIQALPPGKRLSDLTPAERFHLALFQNGSSCVRRSVFLGRPFSAVPYGEDMEWGKYAIESGWTIAYEPSSAVFHCHDRSALYALKRAYADHYQAVELFDYRMVGSVARLARLTISGVLNAWRHFLWESGPLGGRLRNCLIAPAYIAAVAGGQFLGPLAYFWLPDHPWLCRLDQFLRAGV